MGSLDMAYAKDNIFEDTEIGWSIKSLQRCWVVFSLSLDSKTLSYWVKDATYSSEGVFEDRVEVWLNPKEAQQKAVKLREHFPRWDWHVLNVGDKARQERERVGATAFNDGKPLLQGKYRASDAALAALHRHHLALYEEN